MKRSTKKKELKAKRAASSSPDVKRGFRKLTIGSAVYQWRHHGKRVEIRLPGNTGLKWLVPIWRLNECQSEEEFYYPHRDCYDECHITGNLGCGLHVAGPGKVRAYIDRILKAAS